MEISTTRSPGPGRPSGSINGLDRDLAAALARARQKSWAVHGRRIDFFLPGMFILDGQSGLYPAVSLTGGQCTLQCEHCRGQLLEPMIPALSPEDLIAVARDLARRGRVGILISGGSDAEGRLPWERYFQALETITSRTGLTVTVHAGYLDPATARRLKQAGVAQALVDIIGDDETIRRVYHLEKGTTVVWKTMDALTAAGLDVAPHVVLGLDFGRLKGERQAVEKLADYGVKRLVTVVLSPRRGTPMMGLTPPSPEETARFLADARELLPEARHHLGCARPRGLHRRRLDPLAVAAGINALALPADQARALAEEWNLSTHFHKTCCSLAGTNRLTRISQRVS